MSTKDDRDTIMRMLEQVIKHVPKEAQKGVYDEAMKRAQHSAECGEAIFQTLKKANHTREFQYDMKETVGGLVFCLVALSRATKIPQMVVEGLLDFAFDNVSEEVIVTCDKCPKRETCPAADTDSSDEKITEHCSPHVFGTPKKEGGCPSN